MTLEEQFDANEYVISLLNEIKDKIDLELKGRATLLAQIADLATKVNYLIDELVDNDKPAYNKQSDAAVRRRERTWS